MPTWPDVLDHGDLLDACAACASFDDPATVARLRRLADAELVRQAMGLTVARRKAAGKLPHADRLIADAEGVEQATALTVARHKSHRFARLKPGTIIDLCCGIGGDAMALADAADVVLIDRDADRAYAAQHNVRVVTGRVAAAAAADVTTIRCHDRVLHIDPARRDERGRRHRYADYIPGPEALDALLRDNPTAAIKLGPGVDAADLPPGEVEFISDAGTLVQAVLWCGELARHDRAATRLGPPGASGDTAPPPRSLAGTPAPPPISPPRRYLFTVDPAVERAELIGNLCLEHGAAMVHPALGLITADAPIDDAFLTAFELHAVMPWRPRKVRGWLASHDGGIVEVKTRGKAVDPDRVQAQLRGDGRTLYTVFVLRFERERRAYIARRCG